MPRFTYPAIAVALVTLAIPLTAHAQESSFGSGRAIGVTIQAIDTEDGWYEDPAVMLHMTWVRPSRFAFDLGLGTIPALVADYLPFLATDVGIGGVLPVRGSGLMIKGGPSGILFTPGGVGALGVHIAAVGFLRRGRNFGLRIEVIPRLYVFSSGSYELITTYGIGLTSLPVRR